MPNIEYRGHVTLPVVPARDYDARLMRWIISGNGNKPTCERYDGFGTIDGVNVCLTRCKLATQTNQDSEINTMSAKIELGTLIHGTLRDEDLLQAFSVELARIDEAKFRDVIKSATLEYERTITAGIVTNQNQRTRTSTTSGEHVSRLFTCAEIVEQLGEYVTDVINDLIDALNEYAPAGIYFGNIEGDGSDFGFWKEA